MEARSHPYFKIISEDINTSRFLSYPANISSAHDRILPAVVIPRPNVVKLASFNPIKCVFLKIGTRFKKKI